MTGESKVITLASLKFWLNLKMRSILCMFLFPLGFVCMNFFTFAVAIWPVTGQAVENTKWPAYHMSIKTSQAILKCSLRWAQMTKTCLVTLEFFDFVKFTKNIELPAI